MKENNNPFDKLAQDLADGTISRGHVLKIAGAAILGAFLPVLTPQAAKARRRHHRRLRNRCKKPTNKCFSNSDCCKGERCYCRRPPDGQGFCAPKGRKYKCPPPHSPPISTDECIAACGPCYCGLVCLRSTDGTRFCGLPSTTPCTTDADCPVTTASLCADATPCGGGSRVCASQICPG
jgi:hypothetical protein